MSPLSATQAKRASKLISYWLRHDPADAGLELDESGWAALELVVAALSERGFQLDAPAIFALNTATDKVRWEVESDQNRIRARHGHSVAVEHGQVSIPPEVLYHGTATRFLPAIWERGLLPMGRQKVHLAETEPEAAKVGSRHGSPVVLLVRTPELVAAGAAFHRTAAGVWLTDAIAPEFLSELPAVNRRR